MLDVGCYFLVMADPELRLPLQDVPCLVPAQLHQGMYEPWQQGCRMQGGCLVYQSPQAVITGTLAGMLM